MIAEHAHRAAAGHRHGASLLEFALYHSRGLNLCERRFPRGSFLFMPHDDANCVFVVKTGRLRVYIPTEGGLHVFLADLSVGDIVGEVSAISGNREPTVVEAVEDTETYVFARAAFLRVLRECPDGAFEVMRTLCQRLKSLNQRHIENVSLPMAARLAAELVRLASPGTDGVLRITGAPTHAEIANKIGSQREAVTKQLRLLTRKGIVKCRRGLIEILQPDDLLPGRSGGA